MKTPTEQAQNTHMAQPGWVYDLTWQLIAGMSMGPNGVHAQNILNLLKQHTVECSAPQAPVPPSAVPVAKPKEVVAADALAQMTKRTKQKKRKT